MKKLILSFLLIFSLVVPGQVVGQISGKIKPSYTTQLYSKAYCSEAVAVFDAMTTKPSDARKTLINDLIEGLKTDGIWAGLDCFWMMACHINDNGEAQINWKNPGTFDCTNVHATAYEVDRGYTGDGANDYLNTNYNPSTDGINYSLDDASFGAYIRTNVLENKADMGIAIVADNIILYSYHTTGPQTYIRINDNTYINVAQANSLGFYIVTRIANNNSLAYKNKTNIADVVSNSTAIPNSEMFLFAYNNGTVASALSTKQIAAAFVGGGMTQTNVNNFTDRLETFMDAIGAGVISE